MTAPSDPWHYARPKLAQSYLQVFDIGLMSARGLFAKRRMGKSEFLEQDLIPAAHAAGYRTAYLHLWDARDDPAPALLAALRRALEPTGVRKLARSLQLPVSKLKASAKVTGVAEAGLEAELAHFAAAALPALSELVRGVSAERLLIVLDEAQVLAQPASAELAHALRAALDSRKQTIKVIFAGRSEPTLRRMFGRSTEPFYNWAPLEPFELLGDAFVRALVAKVNDLTRYPLAERDALDAFEALQRTPEFFRRFLSQYLTHAQLGAAAALSATQELVFSDANFLSTWSALTPMDQQVLKFLASGGQGVFSAVSRLHLGRALGMTEALPVGSVQNALRRLQSQDVVANLGQGLYQLQDDAFGHWIRQRELEA